MDFISPKLLIMDPAGDINAMILFLRDKQRNEEEQFDLLQQEVKNLTQDYALRCSYLEICYNLINHPPPGPHTQATVRQYLRPHLVPLEVRTAHMEGRVGQMMQSVREIRGRGRSTMECLDAIDADEA